MPVTRREVLVTLADESDADDEETTTIDALASALDTTEATVESEIEELIACELARRESDGRVRVTITGEELLALDAEEAIIVEPSQGVVDG